MTEYHPRWHAEFALDLLRTIEAGDHPELYRAAAIAMARRRLELALEGEVGVLEDPAAMPEPQPQPEPDPAPDEVQSD